MFYRRFLHVSRKRNHITPVLRSLHWIPVPFCINFNILSVLYKALHGLALTYLWEPIKPYHSTQALRSADQLLLVVPRIKCKM